MHPTNGSPSKSSSRPATSTLRPRTRRLISVEDELYPTSGSENGASPFGSRATSPSPRSRPQVTSSPSSSFVRSTSANASRAARDTTNTLSGIWGNSWSAIQDLASNVLGEGGPTDTSTRRRAPQSATRRRTSTSAPPPKQWGPTSSGSHVGAGTQEEREAMVRAMKRKDLLTAGEHLVPDSVGRIKRRTSDERLSSSAPPGENEDRDALVYIHHVRPQDTVAGITIKYNCQQQVLRKANRMWPNDNVQTKKTIVLPVDSCGVKGRRVSDPNAKDDYLLLGEESEASGSKEAEANGLPNGWTNPKPKDTDGTSVLTSDAESKPAWKHDSWVLLPNDTTATEIARMPRRALGFFPPARRKSVAFSDASTPRASIDLPRSSASTNSIANSPTQPTRPRASSTLSQMSSHSHNRHRSVSGFALQGPGGVGTLGRNVRSPGPAQDGLNKLFAAHLPNVAPPPGQEYFTPWAPSLLDADTGTATQYGGSGAVTPSGGAGLDLQEIGGAIEGWVRRVGSQASKMLAEPPPGQGKRTAAVPLGPVGGDLGDLIELRDDAFEIGDGEEDERGRSRADDLLIPTNEQYQSARPDVSQVIRGRRGGSSKKD